MQKMRQGNLFKTSKSKLKVSGLQLDFNVF